MKFSLPLKCIFTGLCFAILFGGCSTGRLNWDPDDYTVRSGDSLYSIAWRYELDPFELARWNNLSSPYIIRPGDRLHTKESDSRKPVEQTIAVEEQPVSTGSIKVEKGDTLYSLARQHNISASQLARINRLKKPYVIHPGQELHLQAGQNVIAPGTSPVTTRPASAAPAVAAGEALLDKDIKISWYWPIKGKVIGQFNQRKIDAKGIDIAGAEGRRIGAAAAGKVVYSGNGLISYGNLVIIKHSRSYLSAYAHNSKLLVDEGQMVKAGQSIAELGSTGTDSPRLHFEIRKNGKPVDPLKYLPSS